MDILKHNFVNLLFSVFLPFVALVFGLIWAFNSPVTKTPSKIQLLAPSMSMVNEDIVAVSMSQLIELNLTDVEKLRLETAKKFDDFFGSNLTVISTQTDEFSKYKMGTTVPGVFEWEIERIRNSRKSTHRQN